MRRTLRTALTSAEEARSVTTILTAAGITLLLLLVMLGLFWVMSKVFPKGYAKLESWEGSVFRSLRFHSHEIVSAGDLSTFCIILLKGIRVLATFTIIYFFITYTLSLFPCTRHLTVAPFLDGIFLAVLTTTAAVVIFKAVDTFFATLIKKIDDWRGTLIKPIKLKAVEILSEERIVEMTVGSFKLLRLLSIIASLYQQQNPESGIRGLVRFYL